MYCISAVHMQYTCTVYSAVLALGKVYTQSYDCKSLYRQSLLFSTVSVHNTWADQSVLDQASCTVVQTASCKIVSCTVVQTVSCPAQQASPDQS